MNKIPERILQSESMEWLKENMPKDLLKRFQKELHQEFDIIDRHLQTLARERHDAVDKYNNTIEGRLEHLESLERERADKDPHGRY